MSKTLAKILGRDESAVTAEIAKLEARSGYPSEDIRVFAENKRLLRMKISQLGLDPDDTTDEELFYALHARYAKDSQIIDKVLGTGLSASYTERLNKAIQLIQHCASSDEAWVVKNSTLRGLMTKNAPKQTSKLLGYRSVSSMIKREDAAVVHLIATMLESKTWRKAAEAQLNKLNGTHYEMRPIKILKFENRSWAKLANPDHHIVTSQASGAVALWPSEDLNNASVLGLTLLLLEGIRKLNPSGYSETLHKLSPALQWWADTESLISDGERPISFNIKDVALNHFKNHHLTSAVVRNGARALWHNLNARYERLAAAISDKVSDVQPSFNQTKLPTSAELAEEYAVAE